LEIKFALLGNEVSGNRTKLRSLVPFQSFRSVNEDRPTGAPVAGAASTAAEPGPFVSAFIRELSQVWILYHFGSTLDTGFVVLLSPRLVFKSVNGYSKVHYTGI